MSDARYDVFVSYRWVQPDMAWVRDDLVPALQHAGLRVCLDVLDFVPGRDLVLEMTRAGQSSRRALCVLSPDYFEGNRMAGFEAQNARRSDPAGQRSMLVPLILRETDLPEWIRGLVPIEWTDPSAHTREWHRLLEVLQAPDTTAPPPGVLLESLPGRSPAPREDIGPEDAIRLKSDADFRLFLFEQEGLAVANDVRRRLAENIDRAYDPSSVQQNSLDLRVEAFILPFVRERIRIEGRARRESKIPFSRARIEEVRASLGDLVTSRWPVCVYDSFEDALTHVERRSGRVHEYKERELSESRRRLSATSPDRLLSVVNDLLVSEAAQVALDCRRATS